jgi:ADP-heptose:LPS heptosyltransferase
VRKAGGKILIINLTRMGDLLQMTPFLGAFRQENPEVEVTLLVLKEFEEICGGFPFVDRVETFDGRDLVTRVTDPGRSLVESYRAIEDIVKRLRHRKFNTVINLSFSRYSGLLTSLLDARDVRGITIDSHGNRLICHPWINHFYNMAKNREINPFNYVDFIKKIGGTSLKSPMFFAVSESGMDFADAFYRDHGVSDADFLVGLQPGASSESKRWPAEHFGALAEGLIGEGSKVVLFGSPGERELGERIREVLSLPPERMETHFFEMIGKTSVDQLGALLSKCDLLVTNDTGTMHLATAMGTRVVEVSLGPVYFPETGPYGEDHVVIQTEVPCAPCGFHVQ